MLGQLFTMARIQTDTRSLLQLMLPKMVRPTRVCTGMTSNLGDNTRLIGLGGICGMMNADLFDCLCAALIEGTSRTFTTQSRSEQFVWLGLGAVGDGHLVSQLWWLPWWWPPYQCAQKGMAPPDTKNHWLWMITMIDLLILYAFVVTCGWLIVVDYLCL